MRPTATACPPTSPQQHHHHTTITNNNSRKSASARAIHLAIITTPTTSHSTPQATASQTSDHGGNNNSSRRNNILITVPTGIGIPRPLIVGGPAGPEPPFPLRMEGKVINGFGRGSKELGIPTANLPVDDAAAPWISAARSGVYFGWASLLLPAGHPDNSSRTLSSSPPPPPPSSSSSSWSPSAPPAPPQPPFIIYPMVMSIGYNPFYGNTVRSAEVHVLHRFAADFYGARMRLLLLGYVRDERSYPGLDALVADINLDCRVARASLARAAWRPREAATHGCGGEAEEVVEGEEKEGGKLAAVGTLDGSWLVRPVGEGEGEGKGTGSDGEGV